MYIHFIVHDVSRPRTDTVQTQHVTTGCSDSHSDNPGGTTVDRERLSVLGKPLSQLGTALHEAGRGEPRVVGRKSRSEGRESRSARVLSGSGRASRPFENGSGTPPGPGFSRGEVQRIPTQGLRLANRATDLRISSSAPIALSISDRAIISSPACATSQGKVDENFFIP